MAHMCTDNSARTPCPLTCTPHTSSPHELPTHTVLIWLHGHGADGKPRVELRVWDWDLVSEDDFLGQLEIPFRELLESPTISGGGAPPPPPPAPRWLPLYAFDRSGRRVDAGEVLVAAWCRDGSGGGNEAEGDEGVDSEPGELTRR